MTHDRALLERLRSEIKAKFALLKAGVIGHLALLDEPPLTPRQILALGDRISAYESDLLSDTVDGVLVTRWTPEEIHQGRIDHDREIARCDK